MVSSFSSLCFCFLIGLMIGSGVQVLMDDKPLYPKKVAVVIIILALVATLARVVLF